MTDQVIGYECVDKANGRPLRRAALDLPPMVYVTKGLWCVMHPSIGENVARQGYDLLGSLHAAEHAVIGVMPMVVLADRNDIGGLATPFHPQTDSATIFIFDGVPGGAGFSQQGFTEKEKLLRLSLEAVERCGCKNGCPACIHSPKCGSGNHPMDKDGAKFLLTILTRPGKAQKRKKARPAEPSQQAHRPVGLKLSKRFGVFDLETQRSASEVGGWHMAHHMKISCGVVYDARDDTFAVYHEPEIPQLIAHLKQLDTVIGFNSKRFDYRVLSGYSAYDFRQLPSLDLLEIVHRQLGFRLSLNHLAEQTLGISKSGSGLDALRWWKEGHMDKIITYCRKDVQITRDLYLFARDNGYLIYRMKDGERLRIPLSI